MKKGVGADAHTRTHSRIAQNTFALLMKAQQRPQPRVMAEPSYKYFNSTAPVENKASCYKCKDKLIYDTCAHCEYAFCGNCLAHCVSCQSIFCGACSVIEYAV